MIAVHDVAFHAVAEQPDGRRTLLVVAHVVAPSGGSGSLGLTVELRSAQGGLLAVIELEPQPVPPGPSLAQWAHPLHLPAGASQARWVADAVTTLAGPLWRQSVSAATGRVSDSQRITEPQPEAGRSGNVRQTTDTSVEQQAGRASPRSMGTTPHAVPLHGAPLHGAPLHGVRLPAAPPAPPPPAPDRFADAVMRSWEEVADAFPPDSLDIAGRDRVRAMLKSDDPDEVTAGCRIATATGWRTTVQAMRRLLEHPLPGIRAVAATGIGALAGPAMEHLLRRRVEQDPDPVVRAAAEAGITAINARSRR